MKVADVMTPKIVTVRADSSIRQAAALMRDKSVGMLVVMTDGEVVGVVSDRDFVIRAIAQGLDPSATTVRQVMSVGSVCCGTDDTVETAARLMEEKKVRRLLVVDQDNRPAGVISVGDIAARVHDKKLAGQVLEQVCSQK